MFLQHFKQSATHLCNDYDKDKTYDWKYLIKYGPISSTQHISRYFFPVQVSLCDKYRLLQTNTPLKYILDKPWVWTGPDSLKGPLLLSLLPKKRVLFSPKPRSFMWITPIQSNKQWTFRQSLDENKTETITAHFRVIYEDILAWFICKNHVNKLVNSEIFRPEVWHHTLHSFWHLPSICDPTLIFKNRL